VVKLSERDWNRLYKEVAVLAQRMTFTKKEKAKWTARDRAQEAVQRACERFLTVKPPSVTTFEEARTYLVAAVRSELWNAGVRWETRKEAEKEAVTDHATTQGASNPSAEQMNLEQGERSRAQARAARIVALTREELAGDTIALGTMDCIADDIDTPAEQAKKLGCPVEEVYLARTRRRRAMARAVARYEEERKDHQEKE
jgi:hypothetical protein